MTRSKKTRLPGLTAAAASALLTAALATTAGGQPPGPPDGPPPEHRDPLRRALDANRDFQLDAGEIAKAAEAIATLDGNGDGTIGREEWRPPMGPPPGGPGGRGADRSRRPGDRGGRPPREDGDGPPPPRDGGPGEADPPRDGLRPGDGPRGERPSPERFLERAKSFDADGDGKLDEGELKRFAEAMVERMRARGTGNAGGPPRDAGERPERPRRPE